MNDSPRIIELYESMYKLTNEKCKSTCRFKHRCCAPEYCMMTIQHARVRGINLKPTGHALPLMGIDGCIAAPHLRPLCTVHFCMIAKFGYVPEDPDWTERYFRLRDQIEEIIEIN